MSNAPIHIGRLIKAELDRQGRKAQWFADQLCFERTNVYNIFRRQSIDADLLLRISQILQYDFFAFYSQQVPNVENSSTNNWKWFYCLLKNRYTEKVLSVVRHNKFMVNILFV